MLSADEEITERGDCLDSRGLHIDEEDLCGEELLVTGSCKPLSTYRRSYGKDPSEWAGAPVSLVKATEQRYRIKPSGSLKLR